LTPSSLRDEPVSAKSADSGPTAERVAVLDFGAQYGQLIARRIRECRVYSEIVPGEATLDEILAHSPQGIVLSGGPASVHEPGAPKCDPRLFDAGIPILGICYGMQLMGHLLGGKVTPGDLREYGHAELEVTDFEGLFAGLNPHLTCWMSHGDHVVSPPPGFRITARTASVPIAAMSDPARGLHGVQFHPEVVHTPWGMDLFRNFLYRICGCQGLWTPQLWIEQAIASIRERVGDDRVVLGLSGGVDSSVVAVLLHRAIGDRLTCVFVDTGLLRGGEPEQVEETFRGNFDMNLIQVRAADRFLSKLAGVTDPERKRNIIGAEFVAIFEEEARRLGDVRYLAQGTLYPDVIESGTQYARTIKSHHNVGSLPERMNLKLIEPLRDLFKDEVRAIAQELELPDSITWRHPFPGPGLAVRILGECTRDRLDILRQADAIVIEEIRRAGWYRRSFQAFAILSPLRSVGVMGDQRTYDHVLIVRAVTSDDAMTADWGRLPYETLAAISNRVINEVSGINRVVYDISSKPPATIEWE